jgi:tetratricopeptide (TPR) repeat protein
MQDGTLQLVVNLHRVRPVSSLPSRLDGLFRQLVLAGSDADSIEDEIWALWMHHPHQDAEEVLERAAREIAAELFDIAESRLEGLVRQCPEWPEAWHKRATLFYLLNRDEESIRDFHRTLELEPRHFGALCGVGEICLSRGEWDAALAAFEAALRLNPHLEDVRSMIARLEGHVPLFPY